MNVQKEERFLSVDLLKIACAGSLDELELHSEKAVENWGRIESIESATEDRRRDLVFAQRYLL